MPTTQPSLSTARLHLLPAESAWARAMLDYQVRNREHFAPWDPTPGGMFYTELFWAMRMRQREMQIESGPKRRFRPTEDQFRLLYRGVCRQRQTEPSDQGRHLVSLRAIA